MYNDEVPDRRGVHTIGALDDMSGDLMTENNPCGNHLLGGCADMDVGLADARGGNA
ncbi:hypothetical protein MOO23_27610 [Rhodococcus opacus]|nr:hypothetical protein [Rhodococcus opacus]UNM99418.1 hypothetical protein MOO23_27610 [Rhodococcus opacus]